MRTYSLSSSEDGGIHAGLLRTSKPHAGPVVTSTIDATGTLLATGAADGSVKVWDLRGGFATHTFHGHGGIISSLHFFRIEDQTQLGAEASKRRHHGKGNAENFDAGYTAGFRLASGDDDGKLRVWDLHRRKTVATLDSHASVVRALDYCPERALLVSASRDQTLVFWNARTWSSVATVPVLEGVESAGFLSGGSFFYTAGESGRLRVWDTGTRREVTQSQHPGAETEALVAVLHHPKLPFVLSVRADQTLLMHSLSTLNSLAVSTIPPLPVTRRIHGTHDEVIDLAYIGLRSDILALATNLEDVRLVSIDEQPRSGDKTRYFGADVGLLRGHSDVIITLDTDWSGHWLVTGAKDNVAKLWRLDPTRDSYTCFATCTGHAESIGAVALPHATPAVGSKEHSSPLDYPPRYLITGSQDKTVKRWDIDPESGKVRSAYTRKAHDKDINALATSPLPAASLFASASQDRTVKIWDLESGETTGVLRGHKRGVWSVAFSLPSVPALTMNENGGASSAKGMVLTGSGDKTVRIWSLSDYTCLRTFEGHTSSVLKVVWLPAPQEADSAGKVLAASAAGDGLVKIWDAQGGECCTTLDNHIDRVWALGVRPKRHTATRSPQDDENRTASDAEPPIELVSGSADSTLTFWTDTSASTALKASTVATAKIEQDQELQNHIRTSNYREAIVLALQLRHPRRLLELFTTILQSPQQADSLTGSLQVDQVLAGLSDTHLWALLRLLRDWNANARTYHVAQHVFHALLLLHPKERIYGLRRRKLPMRSMASGEESSGLTSEGPVTTPETGQQESVKDVLDGLKAYTERHQTRLQRLEEEGFVLCWALEQMDQVGGGQLAPPLGDGVDEIMV